MTFTTTLTRILQAVLFLLFSYWLLLFITTPVRICPDSYGYFQDADHLFESSYQTIRPILFPLFLKFTRAVHLKMSIAAYLLNSATLLYFVKTSSKGQPLFSLRNTIVLTGFFMLVGIWSYCGTYLTEAILPAVILWIFIFLQKVIVTPKSTPATILYSLAICLLAITLKPWIMVMVLMTSGMLFLASLIFRSFRTKVRASSLLLVLSLLSFTGSLEYNRSKSFEKANIVVFMTGSGFENRIKERKSGDKDSAFLAKILADIELINHKYNQDPWAASRAKELRVLDILDKSNGPVIDSAYRTLYFKHFADFSSLIGLALERHVSQLRLDTSCFEIAYGPEIPGLRNLSVILIVAFAVLLLTYQATRPDPSGIGKTGLKPIRKYLRDNIQFSIFIAIILLAGIIFSLLLTLAGAFELQRTVLPAALFQIAALASIIIHPKSYHDR